MRNFLQILLALGLFYLAYLAYQYGETNPLVIHVVIDQQNRERGY